MRAPRAHAEFLRIWEEGYVTNSINFEAMHAHVLYIVDGAPLRSSDGRLDRERIMRRIEASVRGIPYFRLRLMRSLLGLTPPAWVLDEDFDIGRHVSFSDEVEVLSGARLPHLTGLAEGLLSLQHPLWRMRLTELANGDVALGMVAHHVSGDGFSSVRVFSQMMDKAADAPEPRSPDPLSSVRAPRWRGELLWVALRSWLQNQSSPSAAWQGYWSTPFYKRFRRVGGRWLRPARELLVRRPSVRRAQLPARHSDYRVLDSRRATQFAATHGGTLGDLLVAATMRASGGTDPHVRLRLPIVRQSADKDRARNHVRDMEVFGSATDELSALMRSVRAQTESRATIQPPDGRPAGRQIGYTTLVPWRSSPRYFCGARIKTAVPFPAGLPTDELSAAGMLYDGQLTISATMRADSDVSAVVDRISSQMAGEV